MKSKMNKLAMLVYHKEYESFLIKLRDAGVVHVEMRNSDALDTPELQQQLADYNRVSRIVKRFEQLVPDVKDVTNSSANVNEIIDRVEEMYSTLDSLKQALQVAEKDAAAMAAWGEFDYTILEKLKAEGYIIRFFQAAVKQLDPVWVEQYNAIAVNKSGSRIYFVTLTHDGVEVEIDAEPVRLSDSSLSVLNAEVERLKVEIKLLNEQIVSFAMQNLPVLRSAQLELSHEIEFTRVANGGEKLTADKLVLLEGWVPEENTGELKETLDGCGVFYDIRAAKPSDSAPVKLKNNFFTRMYEVLVKMYGMPSGTDFDPTFLVAPFFSLFFAFCMGDSGYGLILILLGFCLKKKMGKDMAGMMNLVITLGIFTTVIGAVLGTFFGINLIDSDIPQTLKNFMIVGDVELFGSTYNKQMILALLIGVVHISIAMTVKAINKTVYFGFKDALSAWGWWLVVVGGITVAALSFMSIIPADISKWVFIAIGGIGAMGIYLFNDLRRNILVNIGAGLWDTYNMASGLLGDILSYIRLFALGLAGGMLGQTFNTLAYMLVDGVDGYMAVLGWIGFGIIVILGHTLNIAMSCISAFVHPLRLTFVEYFKNAGYDGRGIEYKPFKSK